MTEAADTQAVLFANEAFYEALNRGDGATIGQIWSKREPTSCLHPGWPPLIGQDAVGRSWQHITERPPAIRCVDPSALLIADGVMMVICREVVDDTVLAAVNLFRREDDGWRMCHHQAGPTPEAPDDLPGPTAEPEDRMH